MRANDSDDDQRTICPLGWKIFFTYQRGGFQRIIAMQTQEPCSPWAPLECCRRNGAKNCRSGSSLPRAIYSLADDWNSAAPRPARFLSAARLLTSTTISISRLINLDLANICLRFFFFFHSC